MPSGMVSGVGRGMSVLDGAVIAEGEWAVLGIGSEFGCPIVTNGTLLCSCARATCSSQMTLCYV